MKEKMMNNLGIKLLALVIAFLLWVVIINIDDPVDTKTFRDIDVKILNEREIESLDKVYEIISGGNINIEAKAKRSVLKKLKATDIIATADLSEVSATNAVSIQLMCPKYDNVVLRSNVEVLKISLENVATEQFKVSVDTNNTTPAEGYAIGEIRVRPNLIKVSGAETQIKRISEIRVSLDVSGATDNFTQNLEPKVYDANGKLMDSSRMKFSSSKVKVSVSLLETKVVPIHVTTKGDPADGYQLLNIEYEPKEIEIAGTSKVLNEVSEVPITVDISGKPTNVEAELTLADYLPTGVIVVGDTQSINVRCTISKQRIQEIPFSSKDITIRNLSENYIVEFPQDTDELLASAVYLKGDDMEITIGMLHPYLDLEGKGEGEYKLHVNFEPEENFMVTKSPSIQCIIKKKEEDIPDDQDSENEQPGNVATITPVITEKPTATPKPTVEPEGDKDPEEEEAEDGNI